MNKILLLDPFSGISGDMFLGAMVDVGVPFETLRDTVLAIPALAKVTVSKETVTRGVFRATRINVKCPHEHEHRSLSIISDIIEQTDLKASIKRGSIDTFTRLAGAEAKVHGFDIEKVHFHEVGALDAIFDIVAAHVALDLLGNPQVLVRRIALGQGSTNSAHGEIPLPAPATIELLSGFPVVFAERNEELTTPTGAAIIVANATPIGDAVITPDRVGYGAGSREGEAVPNVLRAIVGVGAQSQGRVCIVTSTIDDMNPEVFGYLIEKLFDGGALEVYYNPVMMKKNRPGVEVTLITEEADLARLADDLMAHTTTLGVRVHREDRIELQRQKQTIETKFGPIDVKTAVRPNGETTMSPEFDSCKRAADKAGVSILRVYDAAKISWEEQAR